MDRFIKFYRFIIPARFLFLCLCLSLVIACEGNTPDPVSLSYESGQVTQGEDAFGIFYFYIPTQLNEKTEILVLVHGTPKDLSPAANAEYYVTSWQAFAEKQNYLLIAPAFDQENFSSRYGDQVLGGYRGLFGREIGADVWVLQIVAAFREQTEVPGKQLNLYGHSAGGQFVGRFLVTHPDVVKRAVITSAATYPQPNPEVPWPFGMGELHADIVWDEATATRVDMVPETEKWLAATQLPLTVIVGLNDTAELLPELIPGQKGTNRFVIAHNWVQDMRTFAETNGVKSNFQIEIIPGVGHSMSGLMPYCQKAFLGE